MAILKTNVTAILWTHDESSKGYPVKISIVVGNGRRQIGLGIYIEQKFWQNGQVKSGRMGDPKADEYNSKITESLGKAQKIIDEFRLSGTDFTALMVKEKMTGIGISSTTGNTDVVSYFNEKIAETKNSNKAKNTVSAYSYISRYLVEYLGGEKVVRGRKALTSERAVKRQARLLQFPEVTYEFIKNYHEWLNTRVGNNTVIHHFTILNSWLTSAVEDGFLQQNPFIKYTVPTPDKPQKKDYLTEEELEHILYTVVPNLTNRGGKYCNGQDRAIVLWLLFGCYTGLRVSDWLQFDLDKNVTKTRLILDETEKNEVPISMPITQRQREIVDLLKKEPKPKSRNTFNRVQEVLRKHGIDKKITSHCGRKTFAVTMCAERGISVETCAELMGITIQVCRTNYYEVTQKKIDREVLEAWTRPSIGKLKAV